MVRVEQPEHDARVSQGRLVSSAAETRGARVAACASRPDPDDSASVHPTDTASSGADRRHVHHAEARQIARTRMSGRRDRRAMAQGQAAVTNDARVKAGPPHIGGDDVAPADPNPKLHRPHVACHRPGIDQCHRRSADFLRRRNPARRVDQAQCARKAIAAQDIPRARRDISLPRARGKHR